MIQPISTKIHTNKARTHTNNYISSDFIVVNALVQRFPFFTEVKKWVKKKSIKTTKPAVR